MSDRPIPVLVCIDVEPDTRLGLASSADMWSGYARTQLRAEELRAAFAARTGTDAHLSWFLRADPLIAHAHGSAGHLVEHHRDHLVRMQDRGDEIGVHPHPFRATADGGWVQDFADAGHVASCLRAAVEAHDRVLGEPCRSLRFGDRWLDDQTVALAESLGIRYDLTVEPGLPSAQLHHPGEAATGCLPDYRDVPLVPYAPARDDFRRPGDPADRLIRLVPLSSAVIRTRRLRRVRVPIYPWCTYAPGRYRQLVDQVLESDPRPYLAIAFRAGDLTGGLRPVIEAALGALLAHPAAGRFRLSTPAEALALLD